MIAFTAAVDGNWDLYLYETDTAQTRRLTATEFDERSPGISADGRRIVYTTSDQRVRVLNLIDMHVEDLPLDKGYYGHPEWMANDNDVVFTAYTFSDSGEDADLWVYSAADNNARPYLMQTGVQDFAAVAADGKRIAYVSSDVISVSQQGFRVVQQLWSVSTSDAQVGQLMLGEGEDTEPSWSPDGRRLAFVSDRTGQRDIWIYHPPGDAIERVTRSTEPESSPAWSPDGGRIIYTVSRGGRQHLEIYDTGQGEIVPFHPFEQNDIEVREPTWR